MQTIWKFGFEITDNIEIEMPRSAQILAVQLQGGTPCFWAMVNDLERTETRSFRVIGTGHPIPDPVSLKYIATFQYASLVFHVFEKEK